MKYSIYQLKNIPETQNIRFMPMKWIRENNLEIRKEWYQKVYEEDIARLDNDENILEHLFLVFNLNCPVDFRGHSLSVSDVVVLQTAMGNRAYFCDTFGFQKMDF